MKSGLIVVDGYVATEKDNTDLRKDAWSFALDQRAFGPRRLLVAFADRDGRFRGLVHTKRLDPAERALRLCIEHGGRGAAAAVAYCDEKVVEGPPPPGVAERFASARLIAASYSIHLVDWIACDDQMFRSSRIALEPDCDWWDVPGFREQREMQMALKSAIKHHLRPRGFRGSFPHLRRRSDHGVDLISFYFHPRGGSFVAEVAGCGPSGFTNSGGEHLKPSEVTAHHITWPRPRLGCPDFPASGDHWFVFGPRSYDAGSDRVEPREFYEGVASEVMLLIDEQAESFWRSVDRAG